MSLLGNKRIFITDKSTFKEFRSGGKWKLRVRVELQREFNHVIFMTYKLGDLYELALISRMREGKVGSNQ